MEEELRVSKVGEGRRPASFFLGGGKVKLAGEAAYQKKGKLRTVSPVQEEKKRCSSNRETPRKEVIRMPSRKNKGKGKSFCLPAKVASTGRKT